MARVPFPKWGEPASKGDVITALGAVSSCVVDIYLALSALDLENKEKLSQYIKRLDGHDDKLRDLMYVIGGGEKPNE